MCGWVDALLFSCAETDTVNESYGSGLGVNEQRQC
jgi:hypothetical protein